MRVKAIEMGYYDNKRMRPGVVFNIKSKKHFSKVWMKEVKGKAKADPIEDDIETENNVDLEGNSQSMTDQDVI